MLVILFSLGFGVKESLLKDSGSDKNAPCLFEGEGVCVKVFVSFETEKVHNKITGSRVPSVKSTWPTHSNAPDCQLFHRSPYSIYK